MDKRMTQKIKALAHELGADLVGFANIERFAEAPIKMSPQGIMPKAKTVIVCGIHHPDATIELEGGEHGNSQIFESYTVQYTMNSKLDHISFMIGRYLDNNGYDAVPIVSSNIWRYRSYKELDAVFSPDMSHIYSPVCAGLAELGWNGLAISPEYGARCRYVSIITDAELEPTPLLPGGTLCDMCGECIRCCPTDAYRKEVNGVKMLNIKDRDGKVYTHKFANKNLWRCAWGEHFDLDLDDVIPDVVTEKEILERVAAKGRRGGEMGVCLKVCLPKARRFKDESYSPYYRRKRHFADPELPVSGEIYDRMSVIGLTYHIERITVVSADVMAERGYDLTAKLPNAKAAIVVSSVVPAADASAREELAALHKKQMDDAVRRGCGFANYDIAREIEKMGYSVLPNMRTAVPFATVGMTWDIPEGDVPLSTVIITDAPLEERDWFLNKDEESKLSLERIIADTAKTYGADMIGTAPSERIESITDQLRPIKEGEPIFDAKDANGGFQPYEPSVTEVQRRLYVPSDYLDGAKNVVVIGISYPGETARRAGREPAEAVGPYIFARSQAKNELFMTALEVVRAIRRSGYKATVTSDLVGIGTRVCSPRGEYSSPFDCAFEAVAAGLGELTYSGTLYTEKYGVNQSLICIITDAPLEADAVKKGSIQNKCNVCRKCIEGCPMAAYKEKEAAEITVDGVSFKYIPLDAALCEWASRYVLSSADGDDCLGGKLSIMPNGKVTVENLTEGLKQRDPILKSRPGNAAKCITECPLA